MSIGLNFCRSVPPVIFSIEKQQPGKALPVVCKIKSQRTQMSTRMWGQLEKPLTPIFQVSISAYNWISLAPSRAETYGHCSLWDPAHCSESANVQTCLLRTRLDIGSTQCFQKQKAYPETWLLKWVSHLGIFSVLMQTICSGLSENAKIRFVPTCSVDSWGA